MTISGAPVDDYNKNNSTYLQF